MTMETKNVMVRGCKDKEHEGVKDIVSRWGINNGYWFEQEPKDYQQLRIPHRPDVVLHAVRPHLSRHSLVIIEVQRLIDKGWLSKMQEQYKGQCLVIIPLGKLSKDSLSYIELVKHVEFQMECEVERHVARVKQRIKKPKQKQGDYYITLEDGRRVKKCNEWRYRR